MRDSLPDDESHGPVFENRRSKIWMFLTRAGDLDTEQHNGLRDQLLNTGSRTYQGSITVPGSLIAFPTPGVGYRRWIAEPTGALLPALSLIVDVALAVAQRREN